MLIFHQIGAENVWTSLKENQSKCNSTHHFVNNMKVA